MNHKTNLKDYYRVERFFAQTLRHVKGKWSGDPFVLIGWQKDVIRRIFGEVDEDGNRIIRTAYIEIPRKNGKSTFCAGIALYMLFADSEPGAEVYSGAADREQASIVFDVARQMVEASPVLSSLAKVYRKSIVVESTGSSYKAISREANTKHGFNAHGIIMDELHAQPTRELWDVLRTSTGSRTQPLTVAITTAGYDRESICYEIHDYAQRIIEGSVEDKTFLPIIYGATVEDDWTSPEIWAKANPALDDTLSRDYLETECAQAVESPARENVFKRLHLNIWTEQYMRWITMDSWLKCGDVEVDADALKGKHCWAGLDLASTKDLTALCMVFPMDDGTVQALWKFWVPRDTARQREERDRVPYLLWASQGWIELTDGNETDYRIIRKRMVEIAEDYPMVEIAADRLFQGAQLCQDLLDDGQNVIAFGQGFMSMAAPTVEFERLINRNEFKHGNNPVMNWQAANVAVKMDPAGNIKPDKSQSSDRIDGVVTSIMAIGRMMVTRDETSVYEDRGVILI